MGKNGSATVHCVVLIVVAIAVDVVDVAMYICISHHHFSVPTFAHQPIYQAAYSTLVVIIKSKSLQVIKLKTNILIWYSFHRRSSIGTFIRPHSSEGTASSTKLKEPKQLPPKLDYRSMVSMDDKPELFISVDSKLTALNNPLSNVYISLFRIRLQSLYRVQHAPVLTHLCISACAWASPLARQYRRAPRSCPMAKTSCAPNIGSVCPRIGKSWIRTS